MIHPAEREAERLRVIITTLAEASPDMTMHVAGDVIFEIEKKTAELERVQVEAAPSPAPTEFVLPDNSPRTIAAYIDLRPEIQAEIPLRKIAAIKAVRAECTWVGAPPSATGPSGMAHLGLKEAKDGVEFWEGSAKAPTTAVGWCADNLPETISEWIEDYGDIVRAAYDGLSATHSGNKIQAIKECRALCPSGPSLKEAKDGVEKWAATYR